MIVFFLKFCGLPGWRLCQRQVSFNILNEINAIMVAVLTAALTSAAEIFNVFAIIAVLVIFIFMTNFIMRLQADDLFGTSVVYVGQPPRVQVAVQKVQIPFTLQLVDQKSSSYNGIKLRIESKVPYFLHAFWGLSSTYLNNVLSLNWSKFYKDFVDDPDKQAFHASEMRCLENDNSIELSLNNPMKLGPPTRQHFPLVILLRKQISSEHEDITDVGATISVIHIKDEDMNLSTCLLYQYLKQYSGQFCLLTPLYVQGGYEDGDLTNDEDELSPDETCVVCQVNPASRALLPCRHMCICGQCCNKLETCPMCRSHISQYFLTALEDYPTTQESNLPTVPPSLWIRFTQIFNDLIGVD